MTGGDTEEDEIAMDEGKVAVRQAALKFMVSLTEAKPRAAGKVEKTIRRLFVITVHF